MTLKPTPTMMMKNSYDQIKFPVLLSRAMHHQAKTFSQQHPEPRKFKQIYLNTLAVLAVDYYLQCLAIPTHLAASDSWDILQQTLQDTADLEVVNLGKIECCPVLPNQDFLVIPVEALSERIGYLGVQFDLDLTQAEIIGFLKEANSEEIPLAQLQGLEVFLESLHQLQQNQPVQLSLWLENLMNQGWQTLETFWPSQQLQLAFRGLKMGVKRGKLLNLEEENITLVIGVEPAIAPELNILVQVYPTPHQTYLPEHLQLRLLDAEGISVMEATARSSNKNIQFEFSGERGEHFTVKLTLGDFSISQAFMI